ncbi:MAG: GNAT family N-acetyltransferase [Candidatus Paceibacterota bacterium]
MGGIAKEHLPVLSKIGLESAEGVSFVDEVCFPDEWSWGELEYRADMAAGGRAYYAGFCCGLLVGFGGGKFTDNDEFRLSVIAVEPGHRGMGIGEDLLKLLLDEAEDGGAESAVLEVSEGLSNVCRALLNNGFEIDGYLDNHYGEGVGAHVFRADLLD